MEPIHAGRPRDDLRPGLCTSTVRKRTTIADTTDEAMHAVVILGIFTGGQDVERLLTDD